MGNNKEQGPDSNKAPRTVEEFKAGMAITIQFEYRNGQPWLSYRGFHLPVNRHTAGELAGHVITALEIQQPPTEEDWKLFNHLQALGDVGPYVPDKESASTSATPRGMPGVETAALPLPDVEGAA